MLELGHLLPKFSRWTTSKQKTKSLQLITNTAPTCRQAWGIAKTRPTSGVKQLKRKKTSLSTSSSRPLPPSFPSVLFPVEDDSPLGPPTLIRHQLLQLELSRCLEEHPSSTTPADASMETQNYDKAAPLSLARGSGRIPMTCKLEVFYRDCARATTIDERVRRGRDGKSREWDRDGRSRQVGPAWKQCVF